MIQNKVSIIIPAFNSGEFIETTLNNLFAQTYQNFEIIVAHDKKSTDNSLELLQNIAKEYSNLIVDIGKDTSSGCARNRGLQLATGEYIIFVDADDEIHPRYLEIMMNIFKKHPELDVVCCNYTKVFESTVADGWKQMESSPETYELIEREDALYTLLWGKLNYAPWTYLVKHQYLLTNHINFPDYSTGEDVVYVHKLIANTPKIGHSHKKLYNYILHPSSISHQITPENRWNKCEKSGTDIINYFKATDPEYSEDYHTMMVRHFVYTGVLLHSCSDFIKEMKLMNIKKIHVYHKHDKIAYKLSVICYSFSKRIFYYLAKLVARKMKNITPMAKELK